MMVAEAVKDGDTAAQQGFVSRIILVRGGLEIHPPTPSRTPQPPVETNRLALTSVKAEPSFPAFRYV